MRVLLIIILEVPYELDLILLELIVSSYIGKVLLLNVIKLLSQRKINHIQHYLGLISLIYTNTMEQFKNF